jgi:hypothetical protein
MSLILFNTAALTDHSEQPYCAVIMLLSTFSADYLVKQNEGDIDKYVNTTPGN